MIETKQKSMIRIYRVRPEQKDFIKKNFEGITDALYKISEKTKNIQLNLHEFIQSLFLFGNYSSISVYKSEKFENWIRELKKEYEEKYKHYMETLNLKELSESHVIRLMIDEYMKMKGVDNE